MNIIIEAGILCKYLPILRSLLTAKIDIKFDVMYLKVLDENNLEFVVSDGERNLCILMPSKNAGDFSKMYALQGSFFVDIIRKGGVSGEWQLDFIDNHMILQKDRSNVKLTLRTVINDTYINSLFHRTYEQQADHIVFTPAELKTGFKQVIFAVSPYDQKPILKGVLMKGSAEKIEFVATDGYRLCNYMIDKQNQQPWQGVLSAKTIGTINALLDESKNEISFVCNENGLNILGGDDKVKYIFDSKLLFGEFPKYDFLLNKEYVNFFKCNANDLYKIVDQVGILANDTQIIKLQFMSEKVEVYATHMNIGEYHNALAGELTGESLQLNFRFNFLHQVLYNFGKDNITICLQKTGASLFLSQERVGYRCILLPLSI